MTLAPDISQQNDADDAIRIRNSPENIPEIHIMKKRICPMIQGLINFALHLMLE